MKSVSTNTASSRNLSLVLTGILAGMSLVLEVFVHFPILPVAPFLLYSPGDLPIIVAAVVVGPIAGMVTALVNATLFVVLTGQGGPWGALMHFVASGGMALVIGYLAKRGTGSEHKDGSLVSFQPKRLHLAMLAGIITRVVLMIPLNLLITPIYTGASRSVVEGMIIPAIIPFNLIHAGINTVLSYGILRALPGRVRF